MAETREGRSHAQAGGRPRAGVVEAGLVSGGRSPPLLGTLSSARSGCELSLSGASVFGGGAGIEESTPQVHTKGRQ